MVKTSPAVVIKDIDLKKTSTFKELSANVDGHRIWFRFSLDVDIEPRAEAFLAPAMFEGMVRGEPVRVENGPPVSSRVADSFEQLQRTFRCWNPEFTIIPLHTSTNEFEKTNSGIVCCFSGGVDSTYTYATHRNEVTHLLSVQGFDGWKSDAAWKKSLKKRRAFAKNENKRLISVNTNVREFTEKRKIYWGLTLGGILAGIGLAISPKRFLMPSSWTYEDLHAFGSHPLVDPLWSSETTEIVHHGADTTRSEKIEFLAKSQNLIDQLQVCWRSPSNNCGNCSKCVRTSIVLHILGKKSANLSPILLPKQIKALKIDGEATLPYVNDLIDFASKKGFPYLVKRLTRMRNKYIIRNATEDILKTLLGGVGRQMHTRLRPQEWRNYRAKLRKST